MRYIPISISALALFVFPHTHAMSPATPYQSPNNGAASEKSAIARVGEPGVKPPVFTKKVPPVYPKKGTKKKIQGYVILETILKKNGKIGDMRVLRGIGKGKYGFEKAAKEAVAQWRFQPGSVNGQPEDVRMMLKINFVLRGNHTPVEIRRWSVLQTDSGRFNAPKIHVDGNYLKELEGTIRITIPVVVRISPEGLLISHEADRKALKQIASPKKILKNLQETLKHYTWEAAIRDGVSAETEAELDVTVPLS